jgi:hypothetical protein
MRDARDQALEEAMPFIYALLGCPTGDDAKRVWELNPDARQAAHVAVYNRNRQAPQQVNYDSELVWRICDRMRVYYEANRPGWWRRLWDVWPSCVVDDLMLGLLQVADQARVEEGNP